MKNKEQILENGSVREKIRLYYLDIALNNTYGEDKRILTDQERLMCYYSIKSKKDIQYYDDLRSWSKIYSVFKDTFEKTCEKLEKTAVGIVYRSLLLTQNRAVIKILNKPKIKKHLKDIDTATINQLNKYTDSEDIYRLGLLFYEDVENYLYHFNFMIDLLKKLPLKPYLENIKQNGKNVEKHIINTKKALESLDSVLTKEEMNRIRITTLEDMPEPKKENIEEFKNLLN